MSNYATVACGISFHETLKALDFHVDNFPAERIAPYEYQQIAAAAGRLQGRLNYYLYLQKLDKAKANSAPASTLEWIVQRAMDREG